MRPVAVLVVVTAVGGFLVAAPVPPEAKALVAKLSDPSENVRNESTAALRDRADAGPWLRRAVRSTDRDTARRAAALIALRAEKRQQAAAKALDVCIHDGHIDRFIEWYHYWQPADKNDLWSVGPRVTKAGLQVFAKRLPPDLPNELEDHIGAVAASGKNRFFDSPDGFDQRTADEGIWYVRASQLSADGTGITFASIAGPIRHVWTHGGRFLALGSVRAGHVTSSFVGCDGDIGNGTTDQGTPLGVRLGFSVVVCRGNFCGQVSGSSVVLVDGNVDLLSARPGEMRNCLIRASGEIRLPKDANPQNCTIEAHAKNATAPYKFFELADVGLSVADDEEGLVVTAVQANTPFGTCGLQKGDLIRFIDDAPAGHSEPFRKAVRRALVRQGDCLLTVVRGDKILDLPVFFPLPK